MSAPAERIEEELPPEFDDRQAFAVPPKVKDPAHQKRGKSNRRKGNNAQREWAKLIGGKNIGILNGADVEGPDGCLWEVKALAKMQPALLMAALAEAQLHAVRSHRTYAVAWRLPDMPLERRWVVFTSGQVWLEMHGS